VYGRGIDCEAAHPAVNFPHPPAGMVLVFDKGSAQTPGPFPLAHGLGSAQPLLPNSPREEVNGSGLIVRANSSGGANSSRTKVPGSQFRTISKVFPY